MVRLPLPLRDEFSLTLEQTSAVGGSAAAHLMLKQINDGSFSKENFDYNIKWAHR